MTQPDLTIRSAVLADVPSDRLYRILRLRSVVFVMEQDCPFLDPDGRDLEPDAVHWWIEDPRGGVLSYLRVLGAADGSEIGRVVTAPDTRHEGLAGRLLETALSACARPVAINAQSRLVPWYERYGFKRSGPDFTEDGLLHTPMLLR